MADSNTASPAILQLLIARLSFVLSFCVLPSFLPVALCACFFLPFFDLPFRSDITIMVDRALKSIIHLFNNKKSLFLSSIPFFFFGGGGGELFKFFSPVFSFFSFFFFPFNFCTPDTFPDRFWLSVPRFWRKKNDGRSEGSRLSSKDFFFFFSTLSARRLWLSGPEPGLDDRSTQLPTADRLVPSCRIAGMSVPLRPFQTRPRRETGGWGGGGGRLEAGWGGGGGGESVVFVFCVGQPGIAWRPLSVVVVCRRGSGGGGGGWSTEAAVFGGLVRDRPSPCLLAGRWTQSRSALV